MEELFLTLMEKTSWNEKIKVSSIRFENIETS